MCEPCYAFDEYKFWVIWIKGREPRGHYSTLDAAEVDAKILSKENPGEKVYCLRAAGYGYTPKPETPTTAFKLLNKRPK